MKKKVIIVMGIIILLILLVPIPMHLKDGGTVKYTALTYKISKVHRLALDSETGYEDGIIIEILGMEVLNAVNTNADNNIENLNITVIDTGFSSNAICLKSYSENYKDVEICRYMINK